MQRFATSRRDFARHALHAHRVATIGREVHFEDGVIESERADQSPAPAGNCEGRS